MRLGEPGAGKQLELQGRSYLKNNNNNSRNEETRLSGASFRLEGLKRAFLPACLVTPLIFLL